MTTSYIHDRGPKDAKIVFVFDYPTKNESIGKMPMIGGAASYLTKLLERTNIKMSECYFMFAVPYKPDRLSDIITERKDESIAWTDAFTICKNNLLQKLNSMTPNIVIPMGKIATMMVLGRHDLHHIRGSVYNITLTNGHKTNVLPTYHVRDAMQNKNWQYYQRYDIIKISKLCHTNEDPAIPRNLMTNPSLPGILEFIKQCYSFPYVAFDIEIINQDISCISFAYSPAGEDGLPEPSTNAMSIPFIKKGQNCWTADQEVIIWDAIWALLEDQSIIKIGQNLMFDSVFLAQTMGIFPKNLRDTLICAKKANWEFEANLGILCSLYSCMPYYKDKDEKIWYNFRDGDEQLWVYNAKDSVVIPEIYANIKRVLFKVGDISHSVSEELIEPLTEMTVRGLDINLVKVAKSKKMTEMRMEVLTSWIEKITQTKINLNSNKQLTDYFYTSGKTPPISNGGKGHSCNDLALEEIQNRGFKEAKYMLKWKSLFTFKTRYLEALLDTDNKLRCAFKPHGTVTGRLSSAETIFGRGMNVQNLPKEYRPIITIPEGCYGIEADLSQADNRFVAAYARESQMLDAFRTGKDIHKLTASLLHGIPIEEVTKAQRQDGKTANHGLNYGLRGAALSKKHGMPVEWGENIFNRYHAAYPNIQNYFWKTTDDLLLSGYEGNCFGWKRKINYGVSCLDAYNHKAQSSVAHLTNVGMIFVHKNCKHLFLLNQVHDALWLAFSKEAPLSEVASELNALKEVMEQECDVFGVNLRVPLEIMISKKTFSKKDLIVIPTPILEPVTVEQIERAFTDELDK